MKLKYRTVDFHYSVYSCIMRIQTIFTFLLKAIARPPDKRETYFSYFSAKTYVVGTQKNRLYETVLLSTKTYM